METRNGLNPIETIPMEERWKNETGTLFEIIEEPEEEKELKGGGSAV